MLNRKAIAINAAKAAERIILKNYKKISKITKKDDNSFVTNVDLECERAIFKIIKANTNDSILSEEEGAINTDSEYKWIIDPLDGTHNYIHGFPIFGTSIALEYKGKIILGVINVPLLKHLYVAEKGKGAFLNGKKMHVSKISSLGKSFMNYDFGHSDRITAEFKFLKKAQKNISKIRGIGMGAFGIASIAAGTADSYVAFKSNSWDIAAGCLMLKEAGGRITDFKGRIVDHYTKEFVASNSKLHNKILKLLT